MKDYSGFYYNVEGIYENIIYYVSPLPDQELYMIRKYDQMVDTKAILKSIQTGFNGYNYEVYAVELLCIPFTNPDDDTEMSVMVEFTDYSNRQVFEGVIIVSESMPMYNQFIEYLVVKTSDKVGVTLNTPHHRNENKMNMPKKENIKQNKEMPRNNNNQFRNPQFQAQEGARTIASQIVDRESDNN